MSSYHFRLDRLAKYGLLALLFYVPLTVGAGSFTDTKGIIFAVITLVAAAWILLRWEEGAEAELRRLPLLFYIMLSFLGVGLLFFVKPLALRGSLAAFFLLTVYFVTYGVISTRVKDKADAFVFLWVFTISATLVAIKGLNQYLYEFELLSHHIASNALPIDLGSRVFSTFIGPNALAGFLLLCLPSAFSLSQAARNSRQRIFALVATGIIMVTLALTFSRAGIALTVVLFIVMALASPQRSRRNFLVAVLALAIVVGVLVGLLFVVKRGELTAFRQISSSLSASASLGGRLAFWRGAWRMALASPWRGSGLGTFAGVFSRFQASGAYSQHAHNSYLEMFAEVGFIGGTLFLMIIALVFSRTLRTFRSLENETDKLMVLGLWVGMLGFLLHNLVDFDWYIPATALYFWAFAGLAVALGKATVPPEGTPAAPPSVGPDKSRFLILAVAVVVVVLAGRYFLSLSEADSYAEKGKAALRRGAWDEAVLNLKEAVERDPLEGNYHSLLAQAYLGQMSESGERNRLLKAIAEMKRAVELQPTSPHLRGLLGTYYLKMGKTGDALKEWEKAKKLAPQSPVFYSLVGGAYLEMGRTEEAIRELKKAISYARLYQEGKTGVPLLSREAQSAPRSIYEAYLRLATIHLSKGDERNALQLYDQAIKFSPGETAAYHGKAAFYVSKGDYGEAINNYRKVIELDWQDLAAHFRLGLIYEQIGQYEQAQGEYKEILRIKPDAREARERLNKLLGN